MKAKEFLNKNKKWMIAVVVIAILSLGLGIIINHFDTNYRFKRSILFFCIGIYLYIIRPKSNLHKITIETSLKVHKIICALIALITIVLTVYPMTLNDVWSKPRLGASHSVRRFNRVNFKRTHTF